MRSRNFMVNNAFKQDMKRSMRNSGSGQFGSQELDPGTGRRYEPSMGTRKHNERIHRESKWADDNKNLPFSFSKPKKQGRSRAVKCSNCGNVTNATINTVGIICVKCNQYSSVEEYVWTEEKEVDL